MATSLIEFNNALESLRGMPAWGIVLVIALTLLIWLIPTIMAAFANRNNIGKIFALNVTLGWTTIGWLAILLWAVNPSKSWDVIRDNMRKRKNKSSVGNS